MKMTINGNTEGFDSKISLNDFLSMRNLDPNAVVIELNNKIINKEQLQEIYLKENDILEVLRFVGGG